MWANAACVSENVGQSGCVKTDIDSKFIITFFDN
jgi:hypothetical protein